MHVLISRTDSIGDVLLTLPMTGLIKKKYPGCKISFIGRSYTEAVIKLSKHIDHFINWDEFEFLTISAQAKKLKSLKADWIFHVFPNKYIAWAAREAEIRNRVGTSHRLYHLMSCNKLISFSRRKSELHESQLNCKLLSPLQIAMPEFEDIRNYLGIENSISANKKIFDVIDGHKINIALHPKSKGSAREWGLDNFQQLIDLLPRDRYKIFITGTNQDKEVLNDFLAKNKNSVTDTTGKFELTEFIAFLTMIDCMVSASTGPLHLASVLGKHTVGIYPPIRPIHPGRWAPIGQNSHILVKKGECNDCRKNNDCHCMREIKANDVVSILDQYFPDNSSEFFKKNNMPE